MYIYDVFLNTKDRWPSKEVIVCDNVFYLYEELDHFVVELGNQLICANLLRGSKVGISVSDPIKFIITLLAVNYANAIAIPIYSQTGFNKIEQLVNNFQLNYLISDMSFDKMLNILHENIIVGDLNIYKINDVIDKEGLSDVEIILFSSGTTNMPKAIMLTQANIQTNLHGISEYLKATERDKILLVKNLVHASSLIGELFVSFFNGCTIYMTRKIPTPTVIINLLKAYDITIFFAVPSILKSLMTYFMRSPFELPGLRIINFYGAKMPKYDILELFNVFIGVNIIYSYGLTEAAPRVTYIEGKDLLFKPASSGKPIKNVSVTIGVQTDATNVGIIGEIIIEGSNIMKGYYMNIDLTQKVLKEKMLLTGDLGYLDEDGYLYVTGRKDNMIIASGKNIYPEEIEEVLLLHKDIAEVLVKGEYNELDVFEINAYVVLNNNKVIDKNVLYYYLKCNLENYKIPKRIFYVSKLEKTVTGKIIR